MKTLIKSLDEQIINGLAAGNAFKTPAWGRSITKVLFCGMGGSAIGGDILRILCNGSVPFEVNRTGRFPAWVDSSTLVIFSSYSGNTPEVLQNIAAARKAKAKILALTSGGGLLETARKNKIPYLLVPGGLPPRCAVGYLTFTLVPVLSKLGLLRFSRKDGDEVLSVVRCVSREEARAVARELHKRSVHFYGYSSFAEPVVTRWRAQLAENSKVLSSFHLIPEMMHNEVESWKFPMDIIADSTAVFFSDSGDLAWLKNKIRAAQQEILKSGAQILEIRSKGKSPAARLFSLIVLGDWVSYEMALLNKIDPVKIPTIELLKKVR